MITGTCNFASRAAAIRYYTPYGYDDPAAAVDRKIAEGEINIGRPAARPGDHIYLNHSEGRYFIDDCNVQRTRDNEEDSWVA